MNTITDDQIAEIERNAGFKNGEGFYLAHNIPCADLLGLITRLREVERWKADASQVLNPLLDYAHSLGLAKLGHSVTEALIEDHKRLREAERDAARYRWLRDRGDACQWMNIIRIDLEEFVMQDNALDAAIDAAMLSAREAAE